MIIDPTLFIQYIISNTPKIIVFVKAIQSILAKPKSQTIKPPDIYTQIAIIFASPYKKNQLMFQR
jgi:hypothetical protein